jgi:oligopeptide/dipeptide ABC transporter ATP-binding protein
VVRPEQLTPGASIRGLVAGAAAKVVQVEWFEDQAVKVTFEEPGGEGIVVENHPGMTTFGIKMNNKQGLTADVNMRKAHDRQQRLKEDMQIVFQDPHASLNPRKTIFESVAEPLVIHRNDLGRRARQARVAELLETVGLGHGFMYRYPHELSGGQKQRVCIARAVALDPKLLILDEPTSALDVSVQAQILEFLKDLQARLGLTFLFISHNLAVIRIVCTRVAVMYLGRIVEEGTTEAVFERPKQPYTQALIEAVPLPEAEQPEMALLSGDVPSPIDLPPGCAFHTRCPHARVRCREELPLLRPIGGEGLAACHFAEELAFDPASLQSQQPA